eukprot:6722858-Lingulodinium_polyedra.AAC.1
MSTNAVKDAWGKPNAGPITAGLMALDREAPERFPNCRMDRTRVDRGAGVSNDLEPNGMTGDQQEVVKPK